MQKAHAGNAHQARPIGGAHPGRAPVCSTSCWAPRLVPTPHPTPCAPETLRVQLAGAHALLRGLKAALPQAADDGDGAWQPRMRVQQPQRAEVDVAALPPRMGTGVVISAGFDRAIAVRRPRMRRPRHAQDPVTARQRPARALGLRPHVCHTAAHVAYVTARAAALPQARCCAPHQRGDTRARAATRCTPLSALGAWCSASQPHAAAPATA